MAFLTVTDELPCSYAVDLDSLLSVTGATLPQLVTAPGYASVDATQGVGSLQIGGVTFSVFGADECVARTGHADQPLLTDFCRARGNNRYLGVSVRLYCSTGELLDV